MSSAELARPSSAAAWLQLARVSNAPTVVSNTIAGAALAAAAVDPGPVALVAAAMVSFYTAGMILNDVLDEPVDRRERPERPLPSGAVTRQAAIAAAVALFVIGEALLLTQGLGAALVGLVLVALIVVYDAWHKGNPLSPVLMGACRALVYVVAAVAVTGGVATEAWVAAGVLLLYVVGLTRIAKAERGGILGAWPLAAILAAAGYWLGWVDSVPMATLLVAFAAWVGWAIWLVRGARRVGAGVVSLIAGISLFDALAVASAGGSLVAVAACLAAFAMTIALQTQIAGT